MGSSCCIGDNKIKEIKQKSAVLKEINTEIIAISQDKINAERIKPIYCPHYGELEL